MSFVFAVNVVNLSIYMVLTSGLHGQNSNKSERSFRKNTQNKLTLLLKNIFPQTPTFYIRTRTSLVHTFNTY